MTKRLDQCTTNCYRGLAAVIIMLHHISFQIDNLPVFIKPIYYIAFPIVGFFFFMSGYGLTCGFHRKKDYLNGFLKKRLSNIAVPYLAIASMYATVYIIEGGGGYWKDAIAEAFTIKYVRPMWFVWVIGISYIVFYVVFQYANFKSGVKIFSLLTVAYIGISVLLNPRDEMYTSIIGMPFGIVFAAYEDKVTVYLKKDFWKKEAIIMILFILTFCGRLILSVVGIDSNIVHTILRNIITILFVGTLIGLIKRFKLSNHVLMWLGAISYEIYIVHPFILRGMEQLRVLGSALPNWMIIVVTVLGTLLFSIIYSQILTNMKLKKVSK